jgi:hypothetical protein
MKGDGEAGGGPQGGRGADFGAIGDDDNAAGRRPVGAQQAEDPRDTPWRLPHVGGESCPVTR